MCEIALVSSRKSRLDQEAKNGSSGAQVALKLLSQPEKFLSTVQIGITLVGIIAGAYGGESFGKYLEPWLEKFETTRTYAEEISFTLIVIVITYFSLIIGELVPKTIALNNPEKITIKFAPFMKGLSIVTYPLVSLLSGSTRIFLKIFFIKPTQHPPVTEEELKYLIDTGSQWGIIEKGEGKMIHSVFRFGDKKAKDIMTPKKNIAWLDVNHSREKLLFEVSQSAFSKYPVCNGTLDKVEGVLPLTEVVKHSDDDGFNIRNYLLEPLLFPENVPALNILEEFRGRKIHMGFVIDEHGSTIGLLTLHDLVENIMGDLPELDDELMPVITKRANGSFLVDGDLNLEELLQHIPDLDIGSSTYRTLGGLMIHQLKEKPLTGSYFILGKFKFEVIDMDGNRIDKVMISRI